jgi:hypothetical protein
VIGEILKDALRRSVVKAETGKTSKRKTMGKKSVSVK